MTRSMRRLAELIAPATTQRAGAAQLPLLSMTMHQGLVDQDVKFKKRVASLDTSDYKVVRRGQLVVGFPIDEGVLDFQTAYAEALVSPAYGLWDVRDESTIDRAYLARYLRSPAALSYYRTKLRGTTARRRSLPAEIFLALPVPVPPIDEQKRITHILDRADALLAQHRRAITLLGDVATSTFIDLFGDPLRNERRWPMRKLGEIATTTSGGTPDRSVHDNFGGEVPWVKSGELHDGVVVSTEETLTEQGLTGSSAKVLPPGTILLAMYGATAGAVAILTIPAATNQAICGILVRPPVDALYLVGVLRLMSSHLLAARTGGAQPNLSQSLIKDLDIPLPPTELQLRYVETLTALDRTRTQFGEADKVLSRLHGTLRHRAFRGEL